MHYFLNKALIHIDQNSNRGQNIWNKVKKSSKTGQD